MIIANSILLASSKSGGSLHIPIPDEGILGDSSILTYSSDGSIANATGGDTRTKILSGNWTRVRAQTIRGNNQDDTLASLRDTDGNLTGYGVSISTQLQGSDTIGMNSAGVYPANANRSGWTNPGSEDTARTFSITGLNNSIEYTFTILMSKDSGVTGDGITTVTIAGASGGGSVTDFESKGNVNTAHTLPPVTPNGGAVTISVTKRGVTSVLNVVQIDWTE